MSWELSGRPLRRILVTRLRYLGDIAMATVVLRALRRGDPDLTLGFLCEEPHAPVLRDQPDLDRGHVLRSRRRGRDARVRRRVAGPAAAGLAEPVGTLGMVGQLRRARYDLAVDLFFNPRSAWLLALAGIPARIGGARGSRRRLYTHLALPPAPAARPQLAAVAPGGLADHLARCAPLRHRETGLGFLDWVEATWRPGELRPCVVRPPLDGSAAAAALQAVGAPAPGYTLLAPGATWATKEWPVAHWRTLIAELVATRREPVVVLTAPGGPGRYGVLAGALPAGRGGLLPPLPLGEALRVVAAAGRLVTVDGGVMHAAVAMQRPTVALFGATEPEIWFPYEAMGPYRVLATRPACHPCHRHACDRYVCLPDLAPGSVAAALAAVAPPEVASC